MTLANVSQEVEAKATLGYMEHERGSKEAKWNKQISNIYCPNFILSIHSTILNKIVSTFSNTRFLYEKFDI